jgi:hypothetical protein
MLQLNLNRFSFFSRAIIVHNIIGLIYIEMKELKTDFYWIVVQIFGWNTFTNTVSLRFIYY